MAKSKTGLVKDGFVPGPPKKLVKGVVRVQNTPRPRVTRLVRFIAGRVNK